MKKQKVLLITPPFTQLNTPYPATAYIKGYLNTIDVDSHQMDLGMETILKLFSSEGLTDIFNIAKEQSQTFSDNAKRMFALKDEYIRSIDSIIAFLQDEDPTLSHLICERNFLPEASKFDQIEDLEWAFGTMGIRDQARHISTLYLEDISDFIVEQIDPYFGFSRYAERLGISANSFDQLYEELNGTSSYISNLMIDLLEEKIKSTAPTLVCLTVPFPGNLFAALKCGQWLKKHHPKIMVAMGGGYPNTELRSLSDSRVFEFIDYITLDDGETPLFNLMKYLNNEITADFLKRTYMLVDGKVQYYNGSLMPDVRQEKVGTPDYANLPLKKYLSVIQLTNPMHRLWSDGRWNKLTMAHGCYWGKCTFCDISLDYIKNYEASSAVTIVDRMETIIDQTGERGFHFVDEAAPPALMKAVALEILKRRLVVSWWTNIRFEKSFNEDLCRLLASSGCIAVSGGLEVASDRLLKLIAKGVTIEQVTQVNHNFNEAGIMVHAYLMYGFPTQTDQETIDSLEVVRQLFEAGILQSAFWHRFAMTAHSPVGMYPDQFKVDNKTALGAFANNDLVHIDPTGGKHDLFSHGLKKSLYNYMHGVCLDFDLQKWFDHKVPKTKIDNGLIQKYLSLPSGREIKADHQIVWIGGANYYDHEESQLTIITKQEEYSIPCDMKEGIWLSTVLSTCHSSSLESMKYKDLKASYENEDFQDFTLFWYGHLMSSLREIGLLVL